MLSIVYKMFLSASIIGILSGMFWSYPLEKGALLAAVSKWTTIGCMVIGLICMLTLIWCAF